MKSQRAAIAALVLQALVIAAFVLFTVAAGVPALRHDWSFPVFREAALPDFSDALSTWHEGGLGQPALYPNQYLYFGVLCALSFIFSPVAALATITATIGFLCTFATRTLANDTNIKWIATPLLCIALFNTWTYNELVAGHVTMLLSYSATLLLAATMLKRPERSDVMCFAMLFVAQQLQFFIVAIIAVLLWGVTRRQWLPFVTGVTLGFPVFLGIIFGYAGLLETPYTVPWQAGQSVFPLDAMSLHGYFANYDSALQPLASICAIGLAICALLGFVFNRKNTAARIAFGVALVSLVAASGVHGPIPQLYQYIVEHVKESGLFRELYDFLAYVTICYILLAWLLTSRWHKVAVALCLIAAGMIATWCFAAPSRYWVSGTTLPRLRVHTDAHSRYAVVPAFQPLLYRDAGSGADPDLYARTGDVEPVNEYLPTYPSVTALSQYVFRHDSSLLQGLSVSRIYLRRAYCTDSNALVGQVSSRISQHLLCSDDDEEVALAPTPELSVQHRFEIGSLTANIGAGNVLVSDAVNAKLADVTTFNVPKASNDAIDPRKHWIDARLAFLTHPEIGQPYGGIYTSSREPVTVIAGQDALVFINGKLKDARSDAPLADTTSGFRWISVPKYVDAVSCEGTCAIVLQSPQASKYPVNPGSEAAKAIGFARVTPWLISADLPRMRASSVLRLNERYTPWWSVISTTTTTAALRHVRIDGVVNGWVSKSNYTGGHILIIEVRSLVEQGAELLSTCGLIAIFLIATRRRSKRVAIP